MKELNAICAECKQNLSAETKQELLEVEPCATCIENAKAEGYNRGYSNSTSTPKKKGAK